MHKHFFRTAVLSSLLLAATAFADYTNKAVIPVHREKPKFWMQKHEAFLEQARKGDIDLLFIGDSITDFWRDKGSNVWNQYYAPRKAANFGIRGDLTQHVLWRIEHGELDGINPKVVVLLIGTNNNGRDDEGKPPRNTPAEAVEGVTLVVQKIRQKLPSSKILLLAIFPREDKWAPPTVNIRDTNSGIEKLADGKIVRFLDISGKFLTPDGKLMEEAMPDKLHPEEKGYRIWAEAMEPTLVEMLK